MYNIQALHISNWNSLYFNIYSDLQSKCNTVNCFVKHHVTDAVHELQRDWVGGHCWWSVRNVFLCLLIFLFAADLKEWPLFTSHCEIPPSASPPFHQHTDRRQPFPLSQSPHRMPRIWRLATPIFSLSAFISYKTQPYWKRAKSQRATRFLMPSGLLITKPMNKLSWGAFYFKIKETHLICYLSLLKNALSRTAVIESFLFLFFFRYRLWGHS